MREKPSYDQLISEIDVDQLVGYPDRKAKTLIDSPYLSNLFNNENIEGQFPDWIGNLVNLSTSPSNWMHRVDTDAN